MIRKVVLIYPCSRRYSGFLSTHRLPGLVTSHSGLTILAQLLNEEGIETRVYDEQITPFSAVMIDDADLVGISVQTSWAPQAYRIAARAQAAGKKVMLGGVHATLNPDEAIEHAPLVVRGEGEHTLVELIRALDENADLSTIRGLSWRADGEVHHNPDRPLLTTQQLDAVPWTRELAANVDYIREIRKRASSRDQEFPNLSQGHLWLKDLVSGRAMRPRLR